MASVANTTVAPEVFPEITLQDRCDRCGAAAQTRVTFVAGDLYFCGHHTREHLATLEKTASYIHRKPEN